MSDAPIPRVPVAAPPSADLAPCGAAPAAGAAGHSITFADAARAWLKIGLMSFGGPVGQIAVMHRIIVEEHKWVSERRFLHGLNFCMLLPGPEAMQLATYLGWLLHRTRGGLVAGLLFVLPGALVMFGLCLLYVTLREAPVVAGLFWGVKPAVLAIVVSSMLRVARRTLRHPAGGAIAAGSLVLIGAFAVPFPAVIVLAGMVGWVARLGRGVSGSAGGGAVEATPPVDLALERGLLPHTRASAGLTLLRLVLGACIALAPLAALWLGRGPESVLTRQTAFYAGASVMTFGGAYGVLAYVGQHIVQERGWITMPEMMDGLGLAETTPGPLVLVVQFTAFVAGHHHPESLSPIAAGVVSSLAVLWVTIVPSFVFVLAGGPYVERLLHVRWMSGALAGTTAAVVGVMLNLSLWFGVHTLFGEAREMSFGPASVRAPVWEQVSVPACVLAAGSLVAIALLKWRPMAVLGACAAAGAAGALLGVV